MVFPMNIPMTSQCGRSRDEAGEASHELDESQFCTLSTQQRMVRQEFIGSVMAICCSWLDCFPMERSTILLGKSTIITITMGKDMVNDGENNG